MNLKQAINNAKAEYDKTYNAELEATKNHSEMHNLRKQAFRTWIDAIEAYNNREQN